MATKEQFEGNGNAQILHLHFAVRSSSTLLTLRRDEADPSYDMRDRLDMKDLIERLVDLANIGFSPKILSYKSGAFLKLQREDIVGIDARLPIIGYFPTKKILE